MTSKADEADATEPRRSGRIKGQSAAVTSTEKKEPARRKRKTEDNETKTDEKSEGDGKTKKVKPQDSEGLKIGESLPSISLKNEKGEDLDVASLTAEKGLVLFLVPKADTPGCTQQACGFRDSYPDFTAVDYQVYCLSADSPAAQTKWQTKKNLPYPLLSDPKRELIVLLTGDDARTKRSHFIFEKGGKLLDKKLPVKPVDSPKSALEFIQGLKA